MINNVDFFKEANNPALPMFEELQGGQPVLENMVRGETPTNHQIKFKKIDKLPVPKRRKLDGAIVKQTIDKSSFETVQTFIKYDAWDIPGWVLESAIGPQLIQDDIDKRTRGLGQFIANWLVTGTQKAAAYEDWDGMRGLAAKFKQQDADTTPITSKVSGLNFLNKVRNSQRVINGANVIFGGPGFFDILVKAKAWTDQITVDQANRNVGFLVGTFFGIPVIDVGFYQNNEILPTDGTPDTVFYLVNQSPRGFLYSQESDFKIKRLPTLNGEEALIEIKDVAYAPTKFSVFEWTWRVA